jgi:hypothetical protein
MKKPPQEIVSEYVDAKLSSLTRDQLFPLMWNIKYMLMAMEKVSFSSIPEIEVHLTIESYSDADGGNFFKIVMLRTGDGEKSGLYLYPVHCLANASLHYLHLIIRPDGPKIDPDFDFGHMTLEEITAFYAGVPESLEQHLTHLKNKVLV